LTSATQSTHGAVTFLADGSITYTPVADFNGTDSFTYTVTSPAGVTETATVNVTVTPVADIADDVANTLEDTPVITSVLANDNFSGTTTISAVTQGAHGTVTVNGDKTITYTPVADFNGLDSYTYSVTSAGITETATVSITVTAVVDPVVEPPVVVDPVVVPPVIIDPVVVPPLPVEPVVEDQPFVELSDFVPPEIVATDTVPRDRPLQPSNFSTPLGGDQASDPNVFFSGVAVDRIVRLPVPLNLAVFINSVVENLQQARAATDSAGFSAPNVVRYGEIQSQSIGAGLGNDVSLYVQHAIRSSRAQAEVLDHEVNGRLSRINLSSDRLLPTPELFQADTPENTPQPPVDQVAQEHQDSEVPAQTNHNKNKWLASSDKLPPTRRAAPSFTEQLRVSARNPHRSHASTL
ncbi:MAG: cadherin-like domain-containing protein, partial [Rhodoferax sp.]|uniref:cadherin-like domain-containing protein n=1 Tax=Rhodoferax sp. TaxID=50421 RepID=UPI002732A26F